MRRTESVEEAVARVVKALREGRYAVISSDDIAKPRTTIEVQGSEPRTVDKGFHSFVDRLMDELERVVAEVRGVNSVRIAYARLELESTGDVIENVAVILAVATDNMECVREAYVLGYAVSNYPAKKIVLHPLGVVEAG